MAVVAGRAGDSHAAFKVLIVDGFLHGDHLTGGKFGLLLVARAVVGVAEVAAHAERGGHELHGGDDVAGLLALERLDVLELLLGEVLLPVGHADGGVEDGD